MAKIAVVTDLVELAAKFEASPGVVGYEDFASSSAVGFSLRAKVVLNIASP